MAKHRLSTGIIPTNYSEARIEKRLKEQADARGWKIVKGTIEIDTPRKGMKVAVCDCEDK